MGANNCTGRVSVKRGKKACVACKTGGNQTRVEGEETALTRGGGRAEKVSPIIQLRVGYCIATTMDMRRRGYCNRGEGYCREGQMRTYQMRTTQYCSNDRTLKKTNIS